MSQHQMHLSHLRVPGTRPWLARWRWLLRLRGEVGDVRTAALWRG